MFAEHYFDIVRRNSVLVTHGSYRVRNQELFLLVGYHFLYSHDLIMFDSRVIL